MIEVGDTGNWFGGPLLCVCRELEWRYIHFYGMDIAIIAICLLMGSNCSAICPLRRWLGFLAGKGILEELLSSCSGFFFCSNTSGSVLSIRNLRSEFIDVDLRSLEEGWVVVMVYRRSSQVIVDDRDPCLPTALQTAKYTVYSGQGNVPKERDSVTLDGGGSSSIPHE